MSVSVNHKFYGRNSDKLNRKKMTNKRTTGENTLLNDVNSDFTIAGKELGDMSETHKRGGLSDYHTRAETITNKSKIIAKKNKQRLSPNILKQGALKLQNTLTHDKKLGKLLNNILTILILNLL